MSQDPYLLQNYDNIRYESELDKTNETMRGTFHLLLLQNILAYYLPDIYIQTEHTTDVYN